MRYVGQDKDTVYIKCSHCGTIQPYERTSFYQQDKRKCPNPNCKHSFSFVWLMPCRSEQISAMIPFLVMALFGGLVVFLLTFPAFQRHYYFNKIVTALQPLYISILVSVLGSVASFFFSKLGDKTPKEESDPHSDPGKKSGRLDIRTILSIVAVSIECVLLILLMTVIIQTQYSSLEIAIDGMDGIQQYYGNAIGEIASGNGRLFDSQGQLIYWGGFKDGKYDGRGKKYERIRNIHSTNELAQYQCVYEGSFKAGVPDGEGIEYKYDAKYVFEKEDGLSPYLHYQGEFVDGVYHGNGTLYNIDSKYSGVFYDQEYNGYGKYWCLGTSDDRVFLIEGTFVNGAPQGRGQMYWPNGELKFDGTYENGVMGSGKEYYEGGHIRYNGARNAEGQFHGKGTLYWENGNKQYDGDWENNQRQGRGQSYREDGTLEYSGAWREDQYNGYGSEYFGDGVQLKYLGRFSAGKYSGTGTLYYEGQDRIPRYSGEWVDGQQHGENTWYWENGTKFYEGAFDHGEMTGRGAQYSEAGHLVYKGDFVNGSKEGHGTEYWNKTRKIRYEGEWADDRWSGEGKQFDENGELLYEGQFRDGEFIGEVDTDTQ